MEWIWLVVVGNLKWVFSDNGSCGGDTEGVGGGRKSEGRSNKMSCNYLIDYVFFVSF